MKRVLKIAGILILTVIIFFAGMITEALLQHINEKSKVVDIKENNTISHEQFIEDFTEIHDIVKNNYSHLESKQINADSLFHEYSEYIQAVKTNDEYNNLLLAYFAELRNGHSNVNFLSSYSVNCDLELVENRVFIDRVGLSLSATGINVKDEILAIDDILVLEWVIKQQKFVSASTDKDRFNRAAKRIFFDYSPKTRTILLNTQTGKKEVIISLEKNTKNNIKSSVINDSTGYICIYSMEGNVVGEFKKEFEKLRKNPVLIIDLRYNGGGNSDFSEEITEYLIRTEQKACVSGRNLEPAINHYEGKLIVLIGVNTFSSAESFVLDLKESNNAILIGSETSGDTGNYPNSFTTTHGTSFRIPVRKPSQVSPKGFPMEGVGIMPNITVYQTVEDYLNGVDTVLEFAINNVSSSR